MGSRIQLAEFTISHRRESGAAAAVVAMFVALLVAGAACCILAARAGKPPPLEDHRAWRWVSNAPGATLYVRELPRQPSRSYATVWVAYRFPSSTVSVNADVTELWQINCRQHESRRLGNAVRGYPPFQAPGNGSDQTMVAWRHDSPGTTTGNLFQRVCADID